jgi:tRNA threonylcarbamoyladenosine biosynthesis protein TsaE
LAEATVLYESVIATSDDMDELGKRFANVLEAGDLVILIGPLGAGKTTFTRGVGSSLGVEGNVSSPTFVIARTHKRIDSSEAPLVHVDAYRLSSPQELDDLDIPFEKSIVLVEWGKGITEGISDNWIEIEFERDHSGQSEDRQVKIIGFGERWKDVSF